MINETIWEPIYDNEELGEPIYDTENEQLIYDTDSENIEEIIGYGLYEELDEEEVEKMAGFQTEEVHKIFDQIVNKKFTEINLQEQVDDMLIECMIQLGLEYEEAYDRLNEVFNLPLVTDIVNGKTVLSDFYKPEICYMDQNIDPWGVKRPKPEFVTPETVRPYSEVAWEDPSQLIARLENRNRKLEEQIVQLQQQSERQIAFLEQKKEWSWTTVSTE